jgi:hypothetical protein
MLQVLIVSSGLQHVHIFHIVITLFAFLEAMKGDAARANEINICSID